MFADQTRALIISYGSQQLHRQILGKTRQKKGKNRCSVLRTRAAGKTPLIPCCLDTDNSLTGPQTSQMPVQLRELLPTATFSVLTNLH